MSRKGSGDCRMLQCQSPKSQILRPHARQFLINQTELQDYFPKIQRKPQISISKTEKSHQITEKRKPKAHIENNHGKSRPGTKSEYDTWTAPKHHLHEMSKSLAPTASIPSNLRRFSDRFRKNKSKKLLTPFPIQSWREGGWGGERAGGREGERRERAGRGERVGGREERESWRGREGRERALGSDGGGGERET